MTEFEMALLKELKRIGDNLEKLNEGKDLVKKERLIWEKMFQLK